MPTQPYHTKDGDRVPGCSTIAAIGKDSGGLVHWAWDLGRQGKDYRKVRDEAADAGTIGHALVDAAIKGIDAPDFSAFPEDVAARGRMSFAAYRQWRDMSKLQIVSSEVAMVSERHRFGGTVDAVGHLNNGGLAILDWKCAKLYPDYLYQVAGYGLLWNETYPDDPITGGYHLVRFNRDTGDFHHAYFADLQRETAGFLLKRDLYDNMRETKKRF